ncbi:MAG: hypothetical protein IKM49_03060 [Ruminococcus sp.]|nr:hypothetical protein [Ruminococcus sp.]
MGLKFRLKVFGGELEGKLSSERFPSINTYILLYNHHLYPQFLAETADFILFSKQISGKFINRNSNKVLNPVDRLH